MEKIFVVDTTPDIEGRNGRASGLGQAGEKEEGEVGDHGEEGDGERFKFWVKVDIFQVRT